MFNLDTLVATGSEPFRDYFTPTANQTVFVLAHTCSQPANAVAIVNGLEVAEGVAGGNQFTIAGTTFTWTSTDYALGVPTLTDKLEVLYK